MSEEIKEDQSESKGLLMNFKKRTSAFGKKVVSFFVFCGEHPLAAGVFAFTGFILSISAFYLDRSKPDDPNEKMQQVVNKLDKIITDNQSDNDYIPVEENSISDSKNKNIALHGCGISLSMIDNNIPMKFENSDLDCDYYVPDRSMIVFSSKVEIEPGTKFKIGRNSKITFRDGELLAEGTTENPIIFESEEPIKGYWTGIKLSNLRHASLKNLRIRFAGNNQSDNLLFRDGWESALTISGGKVSIENVSVSESYVNGVAIYKETEIELFKKNKFFANELAGLVTDSEIVPSLDRDSDYVGKNNPNGMPVVNLNDVSIKSDIEETIWPAINAPYLVKGIYVSNHGNSSPKLILEPGVRIAIAKEGRIFSLGEIIAKGTDKRPIIFERSPKDKQHWSSIQLAGNMIFENVIIDGGGSKKSNRLMTKHHRGALVATGYISRRDKLVFKNVLIKNSQTWGIGCDTTKRNKAVKILNSSLGTFQFKDNKEGSINPKCSI